MSRAEEFWLRLAWKLPRRLVYWCAIRLGCHATQGRWSCESPSELLMMDALKRWDEDCNVALYDDVSWEMERQRGW